jgi:hypothetical protein
MICSIIGRLTKPLSPALTNNSDFVGTKGTATNRVASLIVKSITGSTRNGLIK